MRTLERQLNQHIVGETEDYLQKYNDITTLLAEMLDGQMRSSFIFSPDGESLISQDGCNMKVVFENALLDAYELAGEDSRLSFEVQRRRDELDEYQLMEAMVVEDIPNTMIVISEVPSAVYTTGNIGGYDISRQKAMLRVISKLPSGELRIESQSLDRDDYDGYQNIYEVFGESVDFGKSLLGQRIHVDLEQTEQDALVERIVAEYDDALRAKYGGYWYAGRSQVDRRNTYDYVCSQPDIVDYFIKNGDPADGAAMYDFVAYIDQQFNASRYESDCSIASSGIIDVKSDIADAGDTARAEGKTFSGCGIQLSSTDTENDTLSLLGFGNQFKRMSCPFCHSAVWGDPCSSHQKCNSCNAEVLGGKVVSKGNAHEKVQKQSQKRQLGKTALKNKKPPKKSFLENLLG